MKYSVAWLILWLKAIGFTYKKPKIVPGKADSKKQEKWIKEYKVLRENLPTNETIYFIDSLHPTHTMYSLATDGFAKAPKEFCLRIQGAKESILQVH